MAGAPAVGGFIAFWGFWALLAIGIFRQDLGMKSSVVFLALWLAGFVALQNVLYGFLVSPYIAILDIALIFAIFKGDIRIT